MRDEGIENIVARHTVNANAVRAAVRAMELELLASVPSNAATAVVMPDDTAAEITKTMEHTYGVKIAGGQGKLKGKIIRLGHLGHYHANDMITMITALESTLSDLNIGGEPGRGVAALRNSFEEAGIDV